ncbi:MAG: hypothetical protein JXM69_11725 [Anaerolineae bacterium]|nr:hypothetical protein [Anaerolineae bacterium]
MSLSLNIEGILLLLFFIAPGFLFTRTYTAFRPRYYTAPNAFTQFVLAIVGSAIIHATLLTGIALGFVTYWVITGRVMYVNNIFDPIIPLSNYPLSIVALYAFIAIAYLAVSLVLARRFAIFLGYHTVANRPRWWTFFMGQDPPEPFLLWHSMLQIEPLQLDLIPPHLHIQLRNGEYFEGDLHQMRLVGDEENTVELALRNVSRRSSTSGFQGEADIPSPDLEPLSNQVILLKSTDILWLTRNDMPR